MCTKFHGFITINPPLFITVPPPQLATLAISCAPFEVRSAKMLWGLETFHLHFPTTFNLKANFPDTLNLCTWCENNTFRRQIFYSGLWKKNRLHHAMQPPLVTNSPSATICFFLESSKVNVPGQRHVCCFRQWCLRAKSGSWNRWTPSRYSQLHNEVAKYTLECVFHS